MTLRRAGSYLALVAAAFWLRACLNICGWFPPSSTSAVDAAWVILQRGLDRLDWRLVSTHREWPALLLLTAASAVAVAITRRFPPRRFLSLALAAAAAAACLLVTRTLYSTDVCDYLIRGRLLVVHHANPFVTAPDAFPNDPYFQICHWPQAVWVYGPVWLLIITALAALPLPPLGGILAVRLLLTAAHLVNGWLVWKLLEDTSPERRAWPTALYLFCPLTLLESAVNAHCDVLLVTFLLAGAWAAQRGRTKTASVGLTFAALVKIYAAPAVLFYGLATAWRAEKTQRARVARNVFLPACLVAVVLYAPFVHTLNALLAPFRGAAAQALAQSWAATHVARSWMTVGQAVVLARIGTAVALGAGVVLSFRSGRWIAGTGWFFVGFCAVTTWFQPWYALMGLAVALIAESAPLGAAAIGMAVLAPIVYLAGCMKWSALTVDRIFLFTQLLPIDAAVLVWMWESLRRDSVSANR